MNMKQLETFYWIERLGSFSAAAERVHTTQSTISMRVQELEQSLGVKLFERSHRRVRLTSKGKELVPYVRQLIEITAEIQSRITPSETLSGVIKVGVIEIIALTWLPEFIRAMQLRYPNVSLQLEVALSLDLLDKLASGELDVVFTSGRTSAGSNHVIESLGAVEFEWMASPALGIPERAITPAELNAWPFITLNRQSIHHHTIEAWLKDSQVRVRHLIECNSLTVAATLVAAGLGVSRMPPVCYRRELQEGVLRIVETTRPMPAVEVFAMYAPDESQPLAPLITRLAAEASRPSHGVPAGGGGRSPAKRPRARATRSRRRSAARARP